MRSFFGCLWFGLLRSIRRPGRLFGILFPPLVIGLVIWLLPPATQNQPLAAGVSLPEDSIHAQALFDALSNTDTNYVAFYPATEEEIKQNVAAGRWVCGFVAHQDFDTAVTQSHPGRLVTMIETPANTLSPLLREAFSAALYHVRAPYLASTYAQEQHLILPSDAPKLRERATARPDDAMLLHTTFLQGQPREHAQTLHSSAIRTILLGLLAIYFLLFSLLLASDLSRMQQEIWFRRLAAVTGRASLFYGIALAPMLMLTLCAMVSYGLIQTFFAYGVLNATHFASIFAYTLFLTGLSVSLGQFHGIQSLLAVLFPFIPAVCLLLSPIFMDVAQQIPFAAPLSHALPPTWLMHALSNSASSGVTLPGLGLISNLAALSLIRMTTSGRHF